MDPARGNTVLNTNTASTSSATGALVVAGGVGVVGNLNVGGNFTAGVVGSSNLQVTGGGTFSGTLTVGGNTVLTTGGGGTITGGVRFTAFNLGNTSGATITPNPLNGNYQYCVNNGSPTAFNAPSSDCAIDILISNTTGAGAITFTGYTVVSGNAGDALTVTTTARFIMSIRRINSISTYVIKQIAL
jgi:hypothetical protein